LRKLTILRAPYRRASLASLAIPVLARASRPPSRALASSRSLVHFASLARRDSPFATSRARVARARLGRLVRSIRFVSSTSDRRRVARARRVARDSARAPRVFRVRSRAGVARRARVEVCGARGRGVGFGFGATTTRRVSYGQTVRA